MSSPVPSVIKNLYGCSAQAILTIFGSNITRWRLDKTLWISLAIGLVLFYIMLIYMLRRKQLVLKYALFWLASSVGLLIFLLFPNLVLWLSRLFGVANPVNAVFLLFAGVSLALILSLTSIVSLLSDSKRTMIQQLALMEKRIRDLEEQLKD